MQLVSSIHKSIFSRKKRRRDYDMACHHGRCKSGIFRAPLDADPRLLPAMTRQHQRESCGARGASGQQHVHDMACHGTCRQAVHLAPTPCQEHDMACRLTHLPAHFRLPAMRHDMLSIRDQGRSPLRHERDMTCQKNVEKTRKLGTRSVAWKTT